MIFKDRHKKTNVRVIAEISLGKINRIRLSQIDIFLGNTIKIFFFYVQSWFNF